MNKTQVTHLSKMRLEARRSNQTLHSCPLNEEKLHTLAISKATVEANQQCALEPEQVCFCEPVVENYSAVGGGLLVIHRQVRWQ